MNVNKLEEIINICASLGYKYLSCNYKDNKTNFEIEDDSGFIYVTCKQSLGRGIKPRLVGISNKHSINNIRLWCKLNNKTFNLLSNKYDGNNEKLLWKCNICNETFDASWNEISTGNGCPYCSGKRISLSNCLATVNPELAKEWHPTKNGKLTPYDVTCGMTIKVWWLCLNNPNHEWCASIASRKTKGCPYCSGNMVDINHNFGTEHPDLIKEWDYSQNTKTPYDYTISSSAYVCWKCENGHEFEMRIADRHNGIGCPYCAGRYATQDNNLFRSNPELCKEWDYDKNKKSPDKYTPNSHEKVWWKCKNCGNEWLAEIKSRNLDNRGCPKCVESKGESEISNVLDTNNIKYFKQFTFDDLIHNKRKLRFDFAIFHNNDLIALCEYDGEQHYKPVDFAVKGDKWAIEQFNKNKIRDNMKDNYCRDNDIKLLRIPYWDYDNIEIILSDYILKG